MGKLQNNDQNPLDPNAGFLQGDQLDPNQPPGGLGGYGEPGGITGGFTTEPVGPKVTDQGPTPTWDPNVATYVPVNQAFDPKGYSYNGSNLVGNSIPPSGGQQPGGNNSAILQHIADFAAAHPNANPSIRNDPNYWATRIMQTHPDGNIDWGYWESRMLQPEGPPEGAIGANVGGLLRGTGDSQLAQLMQQQLALQQQQMQQQQQMRDQFRQSILNRLNFLQNDTQSIDPQGDALRPIIQAYHLKSQRGLEDTRNALAERAYAQGTLNTGGFDTQTQRALEDAAANEAGFTGQQVSQAVQQRRQELMHLLDVGAGFLSQGDQQAIQTELAQLDANLREQAMAQQNSQFGDQLGYNYAALQAQLNRDSILGALGAYGG